MGWKKGFTLIELLVIIAIVGVMAGAVVVAVNPLSKLNSAKLANVKTFSASVENALIMSQVGKWSFDDSEIPGKDTSGYGNDGTLVGATRVDPAECGLGFGGCLKFDGSNSYVSVANGTSLNLGSGDFTIELWLKSEGSPGNWQHLLEKYSSGNGFFLTWYEGGWILDIGNGGAYVDFYPRIYPTSNEWTHMVYAVERNEGNATSRHYKNGILVNGSGLTQSVGDITTTAPLYMHKGVATSDLIDEIKIYNKALLSYQIQQLYAQGLAKHLLALK